MCGLFGMIATTTTLPQGEVTTLAREAGRRGPNAWGVSWVQPDGTLVRTTQSEALKAHPERLFASVPRMCRAFIGQTRLSTSGTYHEAHKVRDHLWNVYSGHSPCSMAGHPMHFLCSARMNW